MHKTCSIDNLLLAEFDIKVHSRLSIIILLNIIHQQLIQYICRHLNTGDSNGVTRKM